MDKDTLYHHGILGMKWGVRRYQNKDGTLTSVGKRRADKEKKKAKVSDKQSATTKMKEMTDSELKERIARLELEKRYADLSKDKEKTKINKGKAFVMDVIEKSGQNIASQVATYVLGTAVNKIAGSDIINPKKGQKDK